VAAGNEHGGNRELTGAGSGEKEAALGALAANLRALLARTGLGPTQFAARYKLNGRPLSKSTVSRYMNGERLCHWDFVDLLITAAETVAGAPLTGEVRQTMVSSFERVLGLGLHPDYQRPPEQGQRGSEEERVCEQQRQISVQGQILALRQIQAKTAELSDLYYGIRQLEHAGPTATAEEAERLRGARLEARLLRVQLEALRRQSAADQRLLPEGARVLSDGDEQGVPGWEPVPPWWEPAPSGDLPPAPAGRGSAGQGGFPPGNPGRGRPRHRVVWGAAVAAVVLVAATAVVTDRLASGARHNGAVTTPTTAPVSASGPGSSSPTATASSGATPTGAASSGQAPPAPAPTATADAILSTGDVLISDDSGPQLDDNPPVGTVGPDADVTLGTGGTNQPQLVGNFGPSNGTLALWTGKAMPTRTQCMDLVLAQGQHQIPISARNVVCAETNHGRFAVLTILSITSESGALAQATVWTEQVPVPGN